ncbi:hypothetical protein MAPG_09335 [Magnaporthiopsis poae ATCC 64411]|uniref:LysM domain-containing protein n=1 Tax=Magnaporthiopsis poae (strain ATCC 64411 / 73-15) TaxID=644358 RepID=A0A0C4E9N9_MAGP6|nr:hypothetical protein MAPG_09335 [Magnaporthiopsis poae ATCC 64411]
MSPKSQTLALSAFAVGAVLLALPAQVAGRVVVGRDAKPGLPSDPNTVASCSWWHDNDGSMSCSETVDFYALSLADFVYWNPSITASCANYQSGRSYCVEGPPAPRSTGPTTTTTTKPPAQTTTTTTKPPAVTSTKPSPTTTSAGNGVATPTPTQPGMVSNCNKFAFVNPGDSCSAVLSNNKITLAQLYRWNSGVGSQCEGMWAGVYVCVAVIGGGGNNPPPATTTTSAMASAGITLAQFVEWNAAVGDNCQSMWGSVYVCVGVIGGGGSNPPPATTTEAGNGVATPTPTQPGLVGNCNKFVFVNGGDTCASIVSKAGITLAQFTTWNAGVGSGCQSMWGRTYQCVGVIGGSPTDPGKPTTTEAGNGVTTPTPTQANMTKSCRRFHFVQKGQTCATIISQYKISLADFVSWNPDAKSDCTGLWAETYACVAVL